MDLFTTKIETMMKADESDCEVSDREAEKFLQARATENKKASRKLSTTDLKDLKKAKIKLNLVNNTAEVFGKVVNLKLINSRHCCVPLVIINQVKYGNCGAVKAVNSEKSIEKN